MRRLAVMPRIRACAAYSAAIRFVIWVGLAISWLFFAGVTPPLAG